MSTGPGKVERAIRDLIESRPQEYGGTDQFSLFPEDLYQAAFPRGSEEGAPTPWTKAERVSALRAIHRIMAREPGWTTEREEHDLWNGEDYRPKRVTTFRWDRKRAGEKPRTTHEPILAYRGGGWHLTWEPATIVSRGGSRSDRVTVEYDGHKWQCRELRDGRLSVRSSTLRSAASGFCHERARELVEAEHQRRRLHYASPGAGSPTYSKDDPEADEAAPVSRLN